jgi:hypothetical protein
MADTVVMPSEGKQLVANWWRGNGPAPTEELSLRLFSNDIDPFDNTLTAADFTESAFVGYAAAVYTYGENGVPVLVGSEYRVAVGDEVIAFDCTGTGETVRGWYLLDETSGKVLYAVKYETPVAMISGATHEIDLKIGTNIGV